MMKTKTWWARVVYYYGEYGSWIPTGESDLDDAEFYLYRVRRVDGGRVAEWLEM